MTHPLVLLKQVRQRSTFSALGAESEDIELASDPMTRGKVLARILERNPDNDDIVRELSANPSTPPDTLGEMARRGKALAENIARNPGILALSSRQKKDKEARYLFRELASYVTDPDLLWQIAMVDDPFVRLRLLNNNATPAELLSAIARTEILDLAMHDDSNVSSLERLLTHPNVNKEVFFYALTAASAGASNSAAEYILEVALASEDAELRDGIAATVALAENNYPRNMRSIVAGSPSIDPKILRYLANNDNEQYIRNVAKKTLES